ncbi:MAG: acetyl-CoA carboxylase, carboxyltransferase subunit beta [Lachnospiraceae bacterium]
MIMSDIFLRKRKQLDQLMQLRKAEAAEQKIICSDCGSEVSRGCLKDNANVCPNCNHYFPMTPKERILMLADDRSFRELWKDARTENPLDFPDYEEKLEQNYNRTNRRDAMITGTMKIHGIRVAVGVLDSRFLMGSMGTVVGEKIASLAEYAAEKKLPLLIFSASGGARMQEGLFSLMQMAKTSAAIERFKARGGLFLSCLTNPTTGGVSASYANLGDVILAEPKALICFAGPRVIEQTIGQTLPEGFQRAEFLVEHGMIDRIVERYEMKKILYQILYLHQDRGGQK